MTDTVLEQDVDLMTIVTPYEESDDPNRRTHIVSPPENLHITGGDPGMLAQDVVDTARTLGLEVTALCGYRWVPKHDPEKFDSCTACFKIAGLIIESE